MSGPTLNIPQDVINPIIQANISAAILSAMGDGSKVMANAIATVLSTKVDPNSGNLSSYSSNNTTPWIDWMLGQAIRESAKAAIVEYMAGQQEAVKKQLAAELSKKNSPLAKTLVEAMATGMADARALSYSISVAVSARN